MCDADNDGFDAVDRDGFDCDDGDAQVNPGADEVPYDGRDNDCDPITADDDLDGDGFAAADDCDDGAAVTYPGAPETCGDGVINDCDSSTTPTREACFGERDLGTADAKIIGLEGDEWAGWTLASAGDVNLDGHADVLVGAYGSGTNNTGAVYLFEGPLTGELDVSQARAHFIGEGEDDWAGWAVASVPNVFNGVPDLVIGARYEDEASFNAGAVYVLDGSVTGEVYLGQARSKIIGDGDNTGDSLGYAVASAGDVDGDGDADMLLTAMLDDYGGPKAGTAYVFLDQPGSDRSVRDADIQLFAIGNEENFGCSAAGGGDVDGDGRGDILIGSCKAGPNNLGAVYLFANLVSGQRATFEATNSLFGNNANDELGRSVAVLADMDGDGLSEVAVGVPLADSDGEDAGLVQVVYSSAPTFTPDATLLGVGAGGQVGHVVANAGDVNGDGAGDLLIGANGDGDSSAGAAYLFFGPVGGVIDITEADATFTGEADFDFAGNAVAGARDVDGDGYDDILVGAPFHDSVAPSAGAVYLLTFGE